MSDNIDKDEIRRAIDRLQAEHPAHFTFDVTLFDDNTVFNEIQRAIDIVAKKWADDAELNIVCEMAKLYLDGVKPTVKRPHGEWVKTDNRWGAGKWRCTHCDNYSDVAANFCPNCGAEMIQKTCGNCYWFSKVTVPCCEQDKEPTTETEKACDRWEEGEAE